MLVQGIFISILCPFRSHCSLAPRGAQSDNTECLALSFLVTVPLIKPSRLFPSLPSQIQPMTPTDKLLCQLSLWCCILHILPLCYTIDLNPMSTPPHTALSSAEKEVFFLKEAKHYTCEIGCDFPCKEAK